jgi:hypothetical protein
MTIKDINLRHENGRTILSAKCKIRKIGWDTIYFSVASDKRSAVANDASPFAAALLIPSMKVGEDLIIKGSISKQLYSGMHEIMDEVLGWGIHLKRIKIKVDTLTEDTHKAQKTASFFTGGVDSFYTYLKHKNDTEKSDRIDSFILVRGFDIDLSENDIWSVALKNIEAVAKEEQVEMVAVESNVRQVVIPILSDKDDWENPWDYIHGGCLAAVGLFLRKKYARIYIPSTYSDSEQRPRGTSPTIDKHWAAEKLSFLHDGTEATRLNKVCWQIAKSPVALKYLRVCFMNSVGEYNCGTCDKCLRTMVNLYIAGVLKKSGTFPNTLDLQLIADVIPMKSEHGDIFHKENIKALKEKNMSPELQAALKSSLKKSVATPTLADTIKVRVIRYSLRKILYLDYSYAGGHVRSAVIGTPLGHKIF